MLALECEASESRPAVRPLAHRDGRGVWSLFTPRLTALGLYECEASSTGFQPVPDVPQVENLRTGTQGATPRIRADGQLFFWRFQVWPAL